MWDWILVCGIRCFYFYWFHFYWFSTKACDIAQCKCLFEVTSTCVHIFLLHAQERNVDKLFWQNNLFSLYVSGCYAVSNHHTVAPGNTVLCVYNTICFHGNRGDKSHRPPLLTEHVCAGPNTRDARCKIRTKWYDTVCLWKHNLDHLNTPNIEITDIHVLPNTLFRGQRRLQPTHHQQNNAKTTCTVNLFCESYIFVIFG